MKTWKVFILTVALAGNAFVPVCASTGMMMSLSGFAPIKASLGVSASSASSEANKLPPCHKSVSDEGSTPTGVPASCCDLSLHAFHQNGLTHAKAAPEAPLAFAVFSAPTPALALTSELSTSVAVPSYVDTGPPTTGLFSVLRL